MGEINVPGDERNALKSIDIDVLDKLIEQGLYDMRPDALQTLPLKSCGPYVASRLREYENALAEYGEAKAEKKLADMEHRARRAGGDLAHAVQQMKQRVETEEKEGLLFYIDDQIMPPCSFSERLTVRVSYRWRRTIEDEWVYGSVTFSHDSDSRPNYIMRPLQRKPSAAKQEHDRQDKLYREWEHLMKLGLHSVRDHFREGGNGAAIPRSCQAKIDSYTRRLNNFSIQLVDQPEANIFSQ